MAIKDVIKRVADVKAGVNKRAKWDEKNKSDDLRGKAATEIALDIKRNQLKVLPEADPQQEMDLNQKSQLVIEDLTFESVEEGPQAQLLSVQIKNGSALKVEVKDGSKGNLVVITLNTGVTTNDALKAAFDASRAASLMTCSIASGQGSEIAVSASPSPLKGGA